MTDLIYGILFCMATFALGIICASLVINIWEVFAGRIDDKK